MRKLTLLAALGWLLSSCGGLYVEAEEPQICKTVTGTQVPGNPTGLKATFTQQYDYDFGNELLNFGDKKVDTQAQLLSVTFTATSGTDDLASTVDSGEVDLIDGTGQNPPIKVLSYQRPANAPKSATLVVSGGDAIDITKYLSGGKVSVKASIDGSLPPQNWTMDVQTCVWVKVHYNYL